MSAFPKPLQAAPAASGSPGSSGSSGLNGTPLGVASDGSTVPDGFDGSKETPLGVVLDQVRAWLERFIATTEDLDLDLLTLWAAHTHVCTETRTTPRLILDSTLPGSGKTTVLEHFQHLAYKPIMAATLSSASVLARVLAQGPHTIMIDEADRTLDERDPFAKELLATINSGYKVGGKRLINIQPSKDEDWTPKEMPTFGPVVMAGNNPNLPGDTRSRSVRILLMPDIDGTVEDSDWEDIEDDADRLGVALAENLDAAREQIKASRPDLPEGCRARMREKWRPLVRVADVAGGDWPETVRKLIIRDIAEAKAEAADGVAKRPPAYVLLEDLHDVWGESEAFLPTSEILERLANRRPDYWGEASPYGKRITAQRFSRMVTQAAKAKASKNSQDRRGYFRSAFTEAWRRTGISTVTRGTPNQTVETVGNRRTVGNGSCPHGAPEPDMCAECGGQTGLDLAGGDLS
ncbi:DUF3631 domain-containing protein [Actinomyces ruminicola]|uniref:DUF3631 domain-containing protein n=1 Tax=Actinomyces ruminicola TaxID=332524 RepID=A0A1G9SWQ3_9ACTO|nr:DUF3631 domain-containing protein [Actinomyces ruminicola]SDM39861.1 Protein of unknown function [Actinomyces ruminicola]